MKNLSQMILLVKFLHIGVFHVHIFLKRVMLWVVYVSGGWRYLAHIAKQVYKNCK